MESPHVLNDFKQKYKIFLLQGKSNYTYSKNGIKIKLVVK